jgi:hypothetical protein
MTGWIVLLGLLALLLGLALARRRMLQAPGDHLGKGSHVLDGRDDSRLSVTIDRRPRDHDADGDGGDGGGD